MWLAQDRGKLCEDRVGSTETGNHVPIDLNALSRFACEKAQGKNALRFQNIMCVQYTAI